MAEIGRWGGLVFQVGGGYVLGFTGLTIKGAVETTDVENQTIKYVTNKARKPTEVSLTVHLDARTGCNVRDTAMQLVEMATYGAEDYFYIAGKKLVPYRMKLMDATVSEIAMTNKGQWIYCDVKMNMKQCSLIDSMNSGGSSGGGGGSKVSVKKTDTTAAPTSNIAGLVVGALTTESLRKEKLASQKASQTGKESVASTGRNTITTYVSKVNSVSNAGKTATATSKAKAIAKTTNTPVLFSKISNPTR